MPLEVSNKSDGVRVNVVNSNTPYDIVSAGGGYQYQPGDTVVFLERGGEIVNVYSTSERQIYVVTNIDSFMQRVLVKPSTAKVSFVPELKPDPSDI